MRDLSHATWINARMCYTPCSDGSRIFE